MVEIQKDEETPRIFGGHAPLLAVRIRVGDVQLYIVAQDEAHLLEAMPPLAQPRRRLNKRLERVRKD